MFLLSLFAGKLVAVTGALLFVAALFLVENIYGEGKRIAAHFIPTYWAEVALSATPVSGRYRLPSLTYMFSFSQVSLDVQTLTESKKLRRINWENEDA